MAELRSPASPIVPDLNGDGIAGDLPHHLLDDGGAVCGQEEIRSVGSLGITAISRLHEGFCSHFVQGGESKDTWDRWFDTEPLRTVCG